MESTETSNTQFVEHLVSIDPVWYLRKYEDIANFGTDPFHHYEDFGQLEGRLPRSPNGDEQFRIELKILGTKELLFDAEWYKSRYPDVDNSSLEVYEHFLLYGEKEGRSPNAYFDRDFYCNQNPDVARDNAFEHFVRWGAEELRNPSPEFHASFYADSNPDSISNPLLHFMICGRYRGAAVRPTHAAQDFFPALSTFQNPLSCNNVSIIIPVYKGLAETQACVACIIQDPEFCTYNVIIIDDCSPEKGVFEWLKSLVLPNVKILRNQTNCGFVATTNRGIKEAGQNDVILLNSDTLTPANWVSRLKRHAYNATNIASVSPVSNNATICSYPSMGNNRMPFSSNHITLDRVMSTANAGRAVMAPTTVGFCMYIRRSVLESIGNLDEKSFKLGYGEEVDFCQRATAQGLVHKIAWDVFVQHIGEISFGKGSVSRQHGEALVSKRYPYYDRAVRIFVNIDSGLPYRFAATLQLFKINGRDTKVLISHSLGGGIDHYIKQRSKSNSEKDNYILVTPEQQGYCISFPLEPNHPPKIFLQNEIDLLVEVILQANPTVVEVHHQMGFGGNLKILLGKLHPLPYNYFIHDYHTICPRVNLIQFAGGNYCGEPNSMECNTCLTHYKDARPPDIDFWRLSSATILNGAQKVQFPSRDSMQRLLAYFPKISASVVPHDDHYISRESSLRPLPSSSRMRVVVIGVLAEHKGQSLVVDVANLASDLAIDITVIGPFEGSTRNFEANKLSVLGSYKNEHLQSIISDVDPHLIWFPAKWPETYSYTLSEAIVWGGPILAPDIGAFIERLDGRAHTWLYDVHVRASQMITLLSVIRDYVSSNGGNIQEAPIQRATSKHVTRSKRNPGNRFLKNVLLIPERFQTGVPSPCGYIRQILPMNHVASSLGLSLNIGHVRDILSLRPEYVVLQRNCIPDVDTAQRLLNAQKKMNFKILYDIDDDLISFDSSHVNSTDIQKEKDAVELFLTYADMVSVSTENLACIVKGYRSECAIIPNALHNKLWSLDRVKEQQEDFPIRILYMGTSTHGADFDIVKSALKRIKSAHGTKISIEVIGITTDELPNGIQRFHPDGRLADTYPGFVRWLVRQPSWDIGLAPLKDSNFNKSKSSIKAMDYGALMMPVLASNVNSYQGSSADDVGGLLLDNHEQVWYEAIDFAIRDTKWRYETGRKGLAEVRSTHSLDAQQEDRLSILREFFS